MKQAYIAVLLSSFALSCTGGGDATLRIDTSAVQALRSGLDLATGRLGITCTDGRNFDISVPLEDAEQDFTVSLPACGAARAEFRILSTVGIPELQGATDTRLVPGFIELEIPVRYVGQLSIKLADDASAESCIATLARTSPDPEVIDTNLEVRRDRITTLIVPIGSYSVTCEERVEVPRVVQGANVNASLADPIAGPRLASTDINPRGYPQGTVVNILLTFSKPVTGVNYQSALLGGTPGVITSIAGNQTDIVVTISGLAAGDYTLTLTDAIADLDGLPLVGAPIVLPFRMLGNEYYVSTTGDDGNDGLTPATAWRNLSTPGELGTTPALVYVAEGVYNEQLYSDTEIYFEGGWDDTFTVRDVIANETRIRATSQTVFLESSSGGVDGFTIEGTTPQQMVVLRNGDNYVRNCFIVGNAFTGVMYGVFVEGTGTQVIENNVIKLGNASSGRGIHLQQQGTAIILNNTIDAGNNSVATGVWITNDAGAATSIVNNLFVGTTSTNTRTGINASGGNPPAALVNNVFAAEHDGGYFNSFGAYSAIGTGNFGLEAPHRASGNVIGNATATLVNVDYGPQSATLDIGIDTATAQCGFDDISLQYPCNGRTTDRTGSPRIAPTTVGAYQR